MSRILPLAALLASMAFAQLTPEQSARVEELQRALLAPCCYSEPVAEHRSEISLKMRDEIREMVAAGKTNREILDHYKAQYGMRILVEPEGTLSVWLNVIPVVILVGGLAAVVLILRRWRRPVPAESTQ